MSQILFRHGKRSFRSKSQTCFFAAALDEFDCVVDIFGRLEMKGDPVGARLGMCGMEYFGHPWEFGPRKAKELLLTTDSIDADEAYRLGMVSKVYPAAELADKTLTFARRIAQRPTVAALMIKESVNQTVDNMGFYNALQACFTIHQANHSHWAEVHTEGPFKGYPAATVEDGADDWRNPPPILPALKDS